MTEWIRKYYVNILSGHKVSDLVYVDFTTEWCMYDKNTPYIKTVSSTILTLQQFINRTTK